MKAGKNHPLRVTLIGGMDRLGQHYQEEARKVGVNLRIFTRAEAGLAKKIGGSQGLVVFTGNISHEARGLALRVARDFAIPVYQYHSCGVCTLRKCLSFLGGTGLSANVLTE